MMESTLKYMVIGVGNAGSQVAVQAMKFGFPVIVINSSDKDLGKNVITNKIPALIIGGRRGAGRNRDTAKQFLKDDLQKIFSTEGFIHTVQESDVIFVVASTAGGTGSGCAPLLVNRLQKMFPQKIIIFYGILPKNSEAPQAQFNTLECLKEVTNKKSPMTYMLADLSAYENDAAEVAYEKICNYIANTMCVLRGDTTHESPYGMIDENDLVTIIGEPGYMAVYTISSVTQTELEKSTSQRLLIRQIQESPTCRIQMDKKVMKMGIIIDAPSSIEDASKSANFAELEAYTGTPLDAFMNYSISSTGRGSISLIMSGCSAPMDRIADCTDIANKARAQFEDTTETTVADEIDVLDFMVDRKAHNTVAAKTRALNANRANPASTVANIADDIDDDIFG